MTDTLAPSVVPPTSDADPFATEHLRNPEPLHRALREAGPVVRLSRYDVHALARYEEVRAALADWQSYESGAGVGLADFRHEKPWRAPSLLLEADPPAHDAPRRVLREILAPPALRRLSTAWHTVAEELVDAVLAEGTRFDAFTALARAFPLRVFPDAVGLPPGNRDHLLPYGNMAFNAFGPRNELVEADAHRVAELSAWVNAQCTREALGEDGFGPRIWAAADRGDLTEQQAPLVVRSLLTAGVDTTVHGLSA
ncbi:cytochrome P450, partial [Streptomyces sp. NPDC056734]